MASHGCTRHLFYDLYFSTSTTTNLCASQVPRLRGRRVYSWDKSNNWPSERMRRKGYDSHFCVCICLLPWICYLLHLYMKNKVQIYWKLLYTMYNTTNLSLIIIIIIAAIFKSFLVCICWAGAELALSWHWILLSDYVIQCQAHSCGLHITPVHSSSSMQS